MGFFVWKDQFSVNNNELDRQHQHFFKHLNDLSEAIGRADSLECFREAIEELYSYASRHFADEEAYLTLVGYPKIDEQRNQHAFFKSQVFMFEKNLQDNGIDGFNHILVFMRDWFLQHILESDQEYARFVAASQQA